MESSKTEADNTECQTSNSPILCANDCGFFGSASTKNMCSKCYKDLVKKQMAIVVPPTPVAEKISQFKTELNDEIERTDVANLDKDRIEDVSDKQQANRCFLCQKRVRLVGFKCRCGGTFCSSHRFADQHECSFDYKKMDRESIEKKNPMVKADKINKI